MRKFFNGKMVRNVKTLLITSLELRKTWTRVMFYESEAHITSVFSLTDIENSLLHRKCYFIVVCTWQNVYLQLNYPSSNEVVQ